MAALWKPTNAIGAKERIGRRLFDRSPLIGASDQKVHQVLDINHFLDTRDSNISVDRLGATQIERKVLAYLNPRAQKVASLLKPKRPFVGWYVVQAKDLQVPTKGPHLTILASPLNADPSEDLLSENQFHAHIETPATYMIDPVHRAYNMAIHLREIFQKKCTFQHATNRQIGIRMVGAWLRKVLNL